MIVKLTNAALGSIQINDVGEVTSPKLTRKPVSLPYNQSVTLADSPEAAASLASGDLAKQVAAGNVTVEAPSAFITGADSASFTATAGQTVFTLPTGKSMDTTRPHLVHVFQAGAILPKTGAYTLTSATVVTLTSGATLDDDVQIIWTK